MRHFSTARPSIRTACLTIIQAHEYQTPVQWMSINNRRFMVACLHDPAWISLCQRGVRKSLSLGASGMLYDEAFHHYAATHCFSEKHGHRTPATLASGDLTLGQTFQELLRQRNRSTCCFPPKHRSICSISIMRFLISGFSRDIFRPNVTRIRFTQS